jgi:glyoxylase-like metal-dependent hydrolase (beta-lactamase superfamily II)
MASPERIVTDSMIGLGMPDIAAWSERVTVVLGQNPGPFTGPGTNTYVIGTGATPLLLDTGQGMAGYVPLLARALRERGQDRIERIVLTHGHPDHMGGVAAVRQHFGPVPVIKKPWAAVDGALTVEPADEGSEVRTEGATLRALWTPGHAWDHLCWYLVEERALFTGEVVRGAGTTVIPPDGDLGDYLRSLQRLLTVDAAVLYPAHGPAMHNPREKIESYLAHRALRDRQIIDGLRDGVQTVPALVQRIYVDVPPYLHAAAAMSVTAHLRKFEREHVARRDGESWYLV